MFTDQRSRKVILVAHCILNQNAKMDKTAFFPGTALPVGEVLVKSGVGIVQMPCPELRCLGLDRGVSPEEAEMPFQKGNTRVVTQMKQEKALIRCQKLANGVVYQVEEYLKHGFAVAGVIGINRSPSCGVESTWGEDEEVPGSGAFIRVLVEGLAGKGIQLPMAGIKVQEPEQAVSILERMLGK
jgi:predicted secreted protein